jgi:hypothetical protein
MFNAKPARKLQIMIPAISAALLILVASALAMGGEGPKIRAKPHRLMINTDTTLKGKGFPANTTIQLRECGRTSWLAPENPCVEGDETSVVTDAKGRFQTSFHVGLCPEGEPTKRPTQRVCYVGELVTGEDTGSLVGAARLIVSYP